VALRRRPEYWREYGLALLREDMRLEAVNPTQIETVTSMILATTHLVDKYLNGSLNKHAPEPDISGDHRPAIGEAARPPADLQYDAKQEEFEARAIRLLDDAIAIQTSDDAAVVERLSEKARKHGKALAVMGPPGCGKTTRAKKLIRHAVDHGGKVLCAYPTGQMQSRVRAELQAEGLEVDLDTCHGAFCLHKPEQDVLPILEDYALIVVDEFPQLSRPDFERIIRIWENSGKTALLLFLGDFNQLPSIAGTTAKDSPYWKHIFKVRFHTCWRANDDFLLRKIRALRKQVPTRRMRNTILRGHKAWNQAGGPTKQDLRKLYRDTNGKTTIVTCTRKAAHQINAMCAEVCVGRRHQLVELPGDYDANMENYTAQGKLRSDRRPVPCPVAIRKGLRIHLTRNLDKEGDFVNGMECVVKGWDETHRCLEVETITGKHLAVYQYTDPDPAAQNASFFPIRLGYASTIYKMQGAELEHITIYLDIPGQRAAAYVALSRVKRDDDYLFGGKLSRKHFVPNA
jgi:ATP-dependent exoDNAse (exonuclease V) alpha subunit